MAHGRQRYRCKACGRSFTATPPRGKPPATRALAVLLHALGGVSQGMIARLLGVSHVAVYKWVRAAGEEAPTPPTRTPRTASYPPGCEGRPYGQADLRQPGVVARDLTEPARGASQPPVKGAMVNVGG